MVLRRSGLGVDLVAGPRGHGREGEEADDDDPFDRAHLGRLHISHFRYVWASLLRSLLDLQLKKPRSALFSACRIELPSPANLSICGPHFLWFHDTMTRYLLVVGIGLLSDVYFSVDLEETDF